MSRMNLTYNAIKYNKKVWEKNTWIIQGSNRAWMMKSHILASCRTMLKLLFNQNSESLFFSISLTFILEFLFRTIILWFYITIQLCHIIVEWLSNRATIKSHCDAIFPKCRSFIYIWDWATILLIMTRFHFFYYFLQALVYCYYSTSRHHEVHHIKHSRFVWLEWFLGEMIFFTIF